LSEIESIKKETMNTVLTFKDNQVTIGPDQPFVVIGERINPTRRKKLAESMKNGDFSLIQKDAARQIAAGAQVLDVNAGIPGVDESALMRETLQAVMEVSDVPLCIDSANPEAVQAALEIYPGRALINSSTAEEKMLTKIFPLAKEYNAAVICLITDENGIPATAQARLEVARKMVNRAADFGLSTEDLIVDCLAMTVGADHTAGKTTLDSISLISEELGVNINLGASNVSFGLPDRKVINVAYLAMAIARGMTAAITDPTVPDISTIILASDLLMGRDQFGMNWIKAYRERNQSS
jgi:5-methyltetrahydrofolate--homocysteine methyltransferase